MSNEPLNPTAPFIDRLTIPSREQFSSLEQYLQEQSLALELLRSYHELLALPHDLETFKIMSSYAKDVDALSLGMMNVLMAGKVQFDEDTFQAKHGKTFDASREIKGFIISLKQPKNTQVVLLDYGLSRKAFGSADELKRKRFARSVYTASPYQSLVFVTEDNARYTVESYFTVS